MPLPLFTTLFKDKFCFNKDVKKFRENINMEFFKGENRGGCSSLGRDYSIIWTTFDLKKPNFCNDPKFKEFSDIFNKENKSFNIECYNDKYMFINKTGPLWYTSVTFRNGK